MSSGLELRRYLRNQCIVFKKTKEEYGSLSNMAGAYKLYINDTRFLSSEALYQACRFPHNPEVQELIIKQHSPMTAKMVSKPYRKNTRKDWEEVKIPIMRWCLRVKLLCHWKDFGGTLKSTGDIPIVEESQRDVFWGAKPIEREGEVLSGVNALGRLLMELRAELIGISQRESYVLSPPKIKDFLILGQPVYAERFSVPQTHENHQIGNQTHLF